MGLEKDIVHSEAFNVVRQDVLTNMKSDDPQSTFMEAFGFDEDYKEFIKNRSHILVEAMMTETKTQAVKVLLKNSKNLQEYTLLIMALSVNILVKDGIV